MAILTCGVGRRKDQKHLVNSTNAQHLPVTVLSSVVSSHKGDPIVIVYFCVTRTSDHELKKHYLS